MNFFFIFWGVLHFVFLHLKAFLNQGRDATGMQLSQDVAPPPLNWGGVKGGGAKVSRCYY